MNAASLVPSPTANGELELIVVAFVCNVPPLKLTVACWPAATRLSTVTVPLLRVKLPVLCIVSAPVPRPLVTYNPPPETTIHPMSEHTLLAERTASSVIFTRKPVATMLRLPSMRQTEPVPVTSSEQFAPLTVAPALYTAPPLETTSAFPALPPIDISFRLLQ